MTGFCEHGNERYLSIKGKKFLDQMQFSKYSIQIRGWSERMYKDAALDCFKIIMQKLKS